MMERGVWAGCNLSSSSLDSSSAQLSGLGPDEEEQVGPVGQVDSQTWRKHL